jgi:hypothetical protein
MYRFTLYRVAIEVVLDLAIDLVAMASRKIAPSPIEGLAAGLGTARWRNVSAGGPERGHEASRAGAMG